MKKYYHGLDGLRAIAIVSVILYHLLPNVFRGGFLGVPLFFSISGFLIVPPLINEKLDTNRIDFKTFYLKRFKRIYPSLIVMMVVIGVVSFALNDDNNYIKEAISGLLGINHYWQLSNQVSYFDQFKDVRLLKHLWSLSVELEFYLLVPFFIKWLVVGKRYSLRRLKETFVVITLLSWWLMIFIYLFKGNSVAYYLFSTRLFSFSLGMLASYYCFYEKKKLSEQVTIIALILMLVLTFTVKDYKIGTYILWIFIYSCLAGLSIWAVVTNEKLNKALSLPIFKFIGVRSYDVFLWYYPVIMLYQSYFKWDGSQPFFHITMQCLIILVLGHFSYHLSRVITGKRNRSELFKLLIASEGVILLTLSISMSQVVTKQIEQAETKRVEMTIASSQKKQEDVSTENSTAQTTESAVVEKKEIPPIAEDVLFIGDSVMLGTEHYIYESFVGSKTFVDAKVGRQPYEILDDLKQINIEPYRTVIIGLSNNGLMEKSDFDQVMAYLSDKEVILINTAVNRPWKKPNNDLINSYVKNFDNVHLADWDSKVGNVDESELLVEDGVHLSEKGCEEYTYLLKEMMIGFQNE